MDESVTIRMKKSLGGWPPRHAKKEYTVSAAEAMELVTAGYAEEEGRSEPKKSATDDKAVLAERAQALGIDIDARWGVERLKHAIEAAEAAAIGNETAEANEPDKETTVEAEA